MAPTTTTARTTARRLLPLRFVIALIACTFLWGVASVAALSSAAPGQSQETTASSQKPADKSTATPTQQKPRNRFGSIDEEEKPAPKPKNRFGSVDEEQKPAPKPKNRFANVTEEEKPAPKPKNRFGSVDEQEKPAPQPKNRFANVTDEEKPAPKPKNRFGSVAEEEKPAPKPKNRFANVGGEDTLKSAPAKPAQSAPAPKTTSKPANRFATVDAPAQPAKPATTATPAATTAKPATAQAAPAQVAPAQVAPVQAVPAQAAPAASQPAPAKNRFATVAEEDQEAKPAPAPAPAAAKPAAPKNRFAVVEEEEKEQAQKPAEPQTGEQQKPKNRFALEEDEEAAPPKEKVFTYTGTRKCSRCHMKQLNAYRNSSHGRHWDDRTPAADLGCETCHGPGQAHDDFPAEKDLVRTFTRISPREASAFCLKCHDKDKHTEWSSGLHEARNVTCVNCHTIHQAKSEKALLKGTDVVSTCAPCHRDKAARIQRSGHMPLREGKMDCASCHNVHGSTNVRLLKTGATVNESCLKCHADKRGPFLWEHAPVVESCTTCHDPHGSWNDRMLVAKSAMLCERCHIGTRHPSTAYDGAALAARNNRLVNRGCVNCHSMIHGSNHPSGRFLAR